MSRGKTKRNLSRKKSLQVEDKEEEEDFIAQMSEMFSYPFTMILSMFSGDEEDVSNREEETSDEEYESEEEKPKRKRKGRAKTKRSYR
jgi:hypothetical protein